jgi:SH3-like domain-containing protein
LTGAAGTTYKLFVPRSVTISALLGRRLFLGAVAFVFLAGAAPVEDKQGLPIPRFVSMRHGETNLRVGPGLRYPIAWVFTKKDMPVEIVEEFDTWRKIRDWEGTEGWVNHAALAGKRSVIITGEIRALRRSADPQSAPVAQVEPGVVGRLMECPTGADWCRIEIEDVRGWVRRTEIWGLLPQEAFPQ